ncbi:MAG TPA: hypothetical protein VF680_17000 [Allosphingosinicella sp.]|jgi:hypothetical protein
MDTFWIILGMVGLFAATLYVDKRERSERPAKRGVKRPRIMESTKHIDLTQLRSVNPNARKVGNIGIKEEKVIIEVPQKVNLDKGHLTEHINSVVN